MDKCIVCNHRKDVHTTSCYYSDLICCGACYDVAYPSGNPKPEKTEFMYHRFNDNLAYIERLAKERNLI
jgi:hypothetical protein